MTGPDDIAIVLDSLSNIESNIWNAAVAAQSMQGWIELVLYLIAFASVMLIAYICFVEGFRSIRNNTTIDHYGNKPGNFIVFGCLMLIVAFIFLFDIKESINMITNPEFFAALEFVEKLNE